MVVSCTDSDCKVPYENSVGTARLSDQVVAQ
jgi:hypothetical protein